MPALSPSEFDSATLLSRWSFHFVSPMISLGQKKSLEIDDLCRIPIVDHAEALYLRLGAQLERNRRLIPALYAVFRLRVWFTAAIALIEAVCQVSMPVMLWYFVVWLQSPASPIWEGLLITSLMAVVTFVQVILHHIFFFESARLGWEARTATTAVLHRHVLGLRAADTFTLTTGRLVNLVANDVQRFDEGCNTCTSSGSAPVRWLW